MSLTQTSNPFVGLRPFESDESLLFFGRQQQTLELLQRLHENHFVAVVGSSGSGKSSLIRAGLIPALKAGYLVDDRDRWMIAGFKPGQSPLNNFAAAILDQLNAPNTGSQLATFMRKIKEEGADAIVDLLKPLWEERRTNIFFLIDQFEEVFRFAKGIAGLTEQQFAKIVIAYEPVWAIGTGKTATPQMAADAHALIRNEAAKAFGDEMAANLRILYGGSVKPENVKALMAQEEIDGALVGGASLDPKSFTAIVTNASFHCTSFRSILSGPKSGGANFPDSVTCARNTAAS